MKNQIGAVRCENDQAEGPATIIAANSFASIPLPRQLDGKGMEAEE